MKTSTLLITITILALILLGVMYVYQKSRPIELPVDAITETYVHSQYGFKISYPKKLVPESQFASFYLLSPKWRAYASEESHGTPVVSIPVYRIDQGGIATGKPFPLFFSAEVRIGVSSHPDDVASCLKPDPGYTEQITRQEAINGIPFTVFSFGEGVMMKYIEGESYRTVHNDTCYVIERIKTGSNYKDETMTEGKSEAELNAYYEQTKSIVETFQFINQ